MDLKRGPWTAEEDFKLTNYIATHGEGRWNSLSRCAGMIHFMYTYNIYIYMCVCMYVLLLCASFWLKEPKDKLHDIIDLFTLCSIIFMIQSRCVIVFF